MKLKEVLPLLNEGKIVSSYILDIQTGEEIKYFGFIDLTNEHPLRIKFHSPEGKSDNWFITPECELPGKDIEIINP